MICHMCVFHHKVPFLVTLLQMWKYNYLVLLVTVDLSQTWCAEVFLGFIVGTSIHDTPLNIPESSKQLLNLSAKKHN